MTARYAYVSYAEAEADWDDYDRLTGQDRCLFDVMTDEVFDRTINNEMRAECARREDA